MTVTEAIIEHLERMPQYLQQEVLGFVERLDAKADGADTPKHDSPAAPLASLVGSCKGMFASPDEADEHISRERDAWDF